MFQYKINIVHILDYTFQKLVWQATSWPSEKKQVFWWPVWYLRPNLDSYANLYRLFYVKSHGL